MQKAVIYLLKRCSIVRKILVQQCFILSTRSNVIYLVLIQKLGSRYQINTDKCTNILLNDHFVDTIRNSYMFQPLMSHLQGVYLVHSSNVVNKMNHHLRNSKLFIAFIFSQHLYDSTYYTLHTTHYKRHYTLHTKSSFTTNDLFFETRC
jgi:hypothetical protein